MARLYTNENFPRRIAELLRSLSHDVLTSQEAGNANQGIPDEDVLTVAMQEGRAVVTINRRDFIRLHGQRPDHAGIIVCTQDPDLQGQAARIDQSIQAAGSLAGKLLRVNRPD